MANNKIVFGNTTLIDLTNDTATAETVALGKTFIDNSGALSTGTYEIGGASVIGSKISIPGTTFAIPSWSTGSAEDIAETIEMSYKGRFNLSDYWYIGDSRTVTLSAIPAQSPLTETHPSQTVTMTLLNVGGKELVNPIHSKTECLFIVGQLNCLQEVGAWHHAYSATIGWDTCDRRTWCNNAYYNAIPESLRVIFKEHKNITADRPNSHNIVISEDYFSFPAEKEIWGTNTQASSTAEASLSQFKYYTNVSNRIKKIGDNGTACTYGLRSILYTTYIGRFETVRENGTQWSYIEPQQTTYLAPFGVI